MLLLCKKDIYILSLSGPRADRGWSKVTLASSPQNLAIPTSLWATESQCGSAAAVQIGRPALTASQARPLTTAASSDLSLFLGLEASWRVFLCAVCAGVSSTPIQRGLARLPRKQACGGRAEPARMIQAVYTIRLHGNTRFALPDFVRRFRP